jgi:hypothetical protein
MIYLFIYQLLYNALFGSDRFFSFVILYLVGRTPWTGISPSQGLYLHAREHEQNKRTQTSVPRVGFEPTTRVKTVHALDGAATVIGVMYLYQYIL